MFKNDLSFVHKYFMAEKQTTFLFVIIGCSAVLLALIFNFLVRTNINFFKGAAVPLLILGLVQAVVGYTVYARSDKQRLDISYNMGLEPATFVRQHELPRMQKVMRNFVIYRYVEIFLFVAGIALFFYFRTNMLHSFWKGFGLSLALMALIIYIADYFAEKRGAEYIDGLMNFTTGK